MEGAKGNNQPQKPKVKLIKDMKYGKVHLRQSLLELSGFEDLAKVFRNRKEHYSIVDQDITLPTEKSEPNEEEVQIFMSPFERIEEYRKEKINKKMKDKMTKMLGEAEPVRNRPRIPKTTKMLESFQEKYKKEMPISYKEDLRESEINLARIKMNNKRKFQVASTHSKPLYQSRVLGSQDTSSSFITQESPHGYRKRFMSLKTSLPDRDKYVYPSIREMIQGKSKEDYSGPIINLKNIDALFESFINKNFGKKLRPKNEHEDKRYALMRQNSGNYSKPQTSQMNSRKEKANVERSFTRSEESSKQVISTMANFYETKHSKKSIYDEMVENLKYDRPLTSSLRRKNYTVLGKDNLDPISQYRGVSEEERQKIRQESHNFYMGLIEGLEQFHEEEIPTTIFIVEEVRKVFESEYVFSEAILKDILAMVSKMEFDIKTEEVLEKIGGYVGVNIEMSPRKD